MYDIVIVGGGPAGLAASLYSSRAKLKTILIEKTFLGGQMATSPYIENYPGIEGPISGVDLALKMENHAKKFGVEIVTENVVELSLADTVKIVKTPLNDYKSKAVILCLGASPKELGLPKEKEFIGRGVFYCATCDGPLYRNVDVAVVGGGDTALVDALFLTKFCSKVYLIHRRDSFRAVKSLQNAVFNHKKIEILLNSVVEEILGDSEVEGIRIKNMQSNLSTELNLKGVLIAVGSVPNTDLVKNSVKLNEAGYILTDEGMKTSIPGVFAAGDVREKPLRQVITAVSDGAVASYMAERYINDLSLAF